MVKKKVTKEEFCMCCKSKDNLQVSINLLSDPAYLCSKCISNYDGWKKNQPAQTIQFSPTPGS